MWLIVLWLACSYLVEGKEYFTDSQWKQYDVGIQFGSLAKGKGDKAKAKGKNGLVVDENTIVALMTDKIDTEYKDWEKARDLNA